MKKSRIIRITVYAIAMLILILDAKTAVKGAREGIGVCLQTVIPALFPLLVLSVLINGSVTGKSIKIIRPLGQICAIPNGAESILLLGLIGGYPVGAQCIYQAYKCGQLTKEDAKRMLGFCNNAGPAFIFGMSASIFSEPGKSWWLWGIHIVSAILVGIILSGNKTQSNAVLSSKSISISDAFLIAGRTMLSISGWVILFRVIICVISKWIQLICTKEILAVVTGFLELSNGCIAADSFDSSAMQFVFLSGILGFGGCCVLMQTAAATKELGLGLYIQGKIIQCLISILLSSIIVMPKHYYFSPAFIVLLSVCIISAILLRKKTVAFRNNVVYNH